MRPTSYGCTTAVLDPLICSQERYTNVQTSRFFGFVFQEQGQILLSPTELSCTYFTECLKYAGLELVGKTKETTRAAGVEGPNVCFLTLNLWYPHYRPLRWIAKLQILDCGSSWCFHKNFTFIAYTAFIPVCFVFALTLLLLRRYPSPYFRTSIPSPTITRCSTVNT